VIWIFRGFPGITCLQYIVAQLLACFCAAAVVFSLYHDTIIHTNKSLVLGGTGVAFYTQPQEWISNITAFFTEVVATGILLCCVLALGDDGNTPPGAGMQALVTGLLVSALCMAFSYNTGACLNPARDLGPRLFALVAGYGKQVFTSRNFWWIWGPWGATITGGVLGAFFYDLLVFNGGESPINFPGEHWEDLWCDTKAFFEAARAGFQWRGFRSRGSESRDEERCGDMYL
jgi:aquaglyceroporin related protein